MFKVLEWDIEEFKRKFPNLARELLGNKKSVHYKIVLRRTDLWRGYEPNVYDFIRRANTVEQAIEVVDYLVNRGELSREEGEKIKDKLLKEGLQAFGPKKEFGWYLRVSGYG